MGRRKKRLFRIGVRTWAGRRLESARVAGRSARKELGASIDQPLQHGGRTKSSLSACAGRRLAIGLVVFYVGDTREESVPPVDVASSREAAG